MRLSKFFFFTLILLIPLNLGKHFIISDSYVWGVLVDYLIPTFYIQDILAILVLAFWAIEEGFPKKEYLLEFVGVRRNQVLIFFIIASGFSVISAVRFVPSFFEFLRLLLYILLSIYISYKVQVEKDFPIILSLLSFAVIFLGLLGISQYVNQASIFNNYLFFGEQPYSFSTWGIAKENVFGIYRIPAYGLFRHPNIFGGFLSVVLVWLLPHLRQKKVYFVSFVLGLTALFLTFSYLAWGAFLFGFAAYVFLNLISYGERVTKKKLLVAVTILMFAVLSVFALFFLSNTQASFYRRSSLIASSLSIIKSHPLFGVGPAGISVLIDRYTPNNFKDLRFTQPVHNVLLLIFAENGMVAGILFVVFLGLVFKKQFNYSYFSLLLVSLCQVILLGSLDHYIWTISQTSLLFWVIIGLALEQ